MYLKHLGEPNSNIAHRLLHTHYSNRRRTSEEGISLTEKAIEPRVKVGVCIGTACYTKGSQEIIRHVAKYLEENNLFTDVDLRASFCFEKCGQGPNVKINGKLISKATVTGVIEKINQELAKSIGA